MSKITQSPQALARLALLLALVGVGTAHAQVVVVVNPKSSITALTSDQVASVYLGKANTLPGGGAAAAADLSESSDVRSQFYTKVSGKSASQVKAAWSRLVFSGKGTPPRELASSADVKKFVAANPDGIGYIEKSAVDGTVKVVLTVE